MSEQAGPGPAEDSSAPARTRPSEDGRTPPAAQQDDEWAAADALLLGQPTVLGEPGGR